MHFGMLGEYKEANSEKNIKYNNDNVTRFADNPFCWL